MTKHVIKQNGTKTVEVTDDDTIFVLKTGVKITVEDGTGFQNAADPAFGNIQYFINGMITTKDVSTTGNDAILDWGDETILHVSKTGRIVGANGVALFGDNVEVHNAGRITGRADAVLLNGAQDFLVDNSGQLLVGDNGISGVYAQEDATGKVINRQGGVIESISHAGTGALEIVNRGTILETPYEPGSAIWLNGDGNKLINRGLIDGDILAGDGNDSFDLAGGTVNGSVNGGDGNDTYIVDKADVSLLEGNGNGSDTVKSSVSFTLGENFEYLTLLGSAKIDGTGNADANIIFGNTGNNKLHGLAGDDILVGGAGNDLLFGGSETDRFEFINGSGKDRIVDFEDGERIDLRNYDGIDAFSDLQIDVNDDGDAVVTLSDGDRITVENVASLSADDFLIFTPAM